MIQDITYSNSTSTITFDDPSNPTIFNSDIVKTGVSEFNFIYSSYNQTFKINTTCTTNNPQLITRSLSNFPPGFASIKSENDYEVEIEIDFSTLTPLNSIETIPGDLIT